MKSEGMIVYSKRECRGTSSGCLERLQAALRSMSSYRDVVSLLIDYGEFESAVADAISSTQDTDAAPIPLLRHAALATGHALYHAWKGDSSQLVDWLHELGADLTKLVTANLPETLNLRVSEGYAHYGLYPETYIEAAERFWKKKHPDRVICLGIRSIGTSLSAVISATLREQGTGVFSFTVRPRGEPFERCLVLSASLEKTLRSFSDAHFVIADEGPGLSGVTICSVAQRLSELGIPDERIIFFPSWQPDGTLFLSDWARLRWRRHDKYSVSFDELLATNRDLVFLQKYVDVSYGAWRKLFYTRKQDYPAVHPYHERRKFLWREGAGSVQMEGFPASEASNAIMSKFVGLGRYGEIKREHAERLAEAGFSPPVMQLVDGMLSSRFLPGQPVSRRAVDNELVDRMATYLAFRACHLPAARDAEFDRVVQMIRTNVALGLGENWLRHLDSLPIYRSAVEDGPGTAIDGRMLSHEWVATAKGYFKVDGVDHQTHQFFRGCQDIAWDIAGTVAEFELPSGAQDRLVHTFQSQARDASLTKRLPFYLIAYLAQRLGYAELAARELSPSPDGQRFQLLAERYRTGLKQAILQQGKA